MNFLYWWWNIFTKKIGLLCHVEHSGFFFYFTIMDNIFLILLENVVESFGF